MAARLFDQNNELRPHIAAPPVKQTETGDEADRWRGGLQATLAINDT